MSLNYRDFLAEVWRAATTPSLAALVGTLSVAGIILFLCLMLLSPHFIVKYGYHFMEDPKDDYAYLTTEVLKITYNLPKELGVIVVGNSAAKEAIDAKHLAELLSKKIAHTVPVHKLAVGGLFLVEEVCLLDNIQENFQGIIVIQVEPPRLAFDKKALKGGITKHSRLAMYCPAFDKEMQIAGVEPQNWLGNYFLDHYKFFVARLPSVLLNVLRGPRYWDAYGSDDWLVPTQAQWERAVERFARWQENYLDHRADNFGIYSRLIQRLLDKNIKVALLETTINPRTEELLYQTPEKKKMYEQYYTEVSQFAQELGISYWNLSTEVDLKVADFIDHIHVSKPKARRRYTEALASQLVDLLKGMQFKEISENSK
ncbi:MAG: hypothetical protein BWK79_08005 [Beggiatoa sp. IS2]|nr:MAG: hypothetical protein BWK79_08005 [Beggiatoa sp. IS2]